MVPVAGTVKWAVTLKGNSKQTEGMKTSVKRNFFFSKKQKGEITRRNEVNNVQKSQLIVSKATEGFVLQSSTIPLSEEQEMLQDQSQSEHQGQGHVQSLD